jgi:hypothetical protein
MLGPDAFELGDRPGCETLPGIAQQRQSFANQLTQAEIDEAAAAAWRAQNEVKDYSDFFAEVN